MADQLKKVRDHRRGCGWRKKGGLYLMGGGDGFDCGRLPIRFRTCPCCGFGIRPSRQPTWVDADQLLFASSQDDECANPQDVCDACPMTKILSGESDLGQALLIWIGERHYPTISHFTREADRLGISRRIQSVPREFVIGETWVLLAHPNGVANTPKMGEEIEWDPAIFHVFKPTHIEVICDGTESEEQIESYVERNLTPVVVERVEAKPEPLWENEE